MSEYTTAELQAMLDSGKSISEVARTTGIPRTTLSRRLGRYNPDRRDRERAEARTDKKAVARNGKPDTANKSMDLEVVKDFLSKAVHGGGDLIEALKAVVAASESRVEQPKADEKPVSGGKIAPSYKEWGRASGRKFVITSAQNNTDVHHEFLQSLHTFCAEQNAQLVVVPFSYNKNAWENGSHVTRESEDLWYDPEVMPYLVKDTTMLCDSLVLCANLDILPTAANPMASLESYTKGRSGIVPHVKVELVSLKRAKGEKPRIMTTTGAVTQINYVQRKAGQIAEFHHVYGAIYVNIAEDGQWFCWHLIADESGEFQHELTVYTPTGTRRSYVEAISFGDIHIEHEDPVASEALFYGKKSLLKHLHPSEIHIDDLIDQAYRNHHNIKNPMFLAKQHYAGTERVQDSIKRGGAFLDRLTRENEWLNVIVKKSNHDEALDRWVMESDARKDPPNAKFWHWISYHWLDALEANRHFDPLEFSVRAIFPSLERVRFLKRDERHMICGPDGIECSYHGDQGANGARGSANAFASSGMRTNTAHSHSPWIKGGNYSSGHTCKDDLVYNQGMTTWANAHIVTYPTGKRQIWFLFDGLYAP